jgi:putative ABC transport system ATP-binding protein
MSTMANDVALELGALSVSVPDGDHRRVLLDNLDATFQAGQVTVVTGPSGSGKSSLLAIAGLLRRQDDGEVLVGGEPTATASRRSRTDVRRRHLGFVFQSANLLPALTAREQLEQVGRLSRSSRSETRARADALLADVGLGAHAAKLPHELSGGERQRVGIARALMADPLVLLADEPTASLDPSLADEVSELLADQVRQRGIAALIVTHDDAPLAVADRHLELVDRTLRDVGDRP